VDGQTGRVVRLARVLAVACVAALAATCSPGCGDDDSSKETAKVETTKGRVRAPVPVALEDSDERADPDAGKPVGFVKEVAELPKPARRQVATIDVRPAAQRLKAKRAAEEAPGGEAPAEGPDADYDRFIKGVIPLIDRFWREETRNVSAAAEYTEPGDLISYDGSDGPGCFGQNSESAVGNAYYCPSLLAASACRIAASNRRYCLGGDVIAWDRSGLMLPFYREIGGLATALVLAHEWGHLEQARLYPEFTYRTTIRDELQADCYAGAWAREMRRQKRVDIGAFNETLELFERTGGPGDAWLDPDSHGNQFQRIRSFTQGFERGSAGCVAVPFNRMLRRLGLEAEG
jgi:uncharacterized protein